MCEGSPILPQPRNSLKLTRKLPKVFRHRLWRTLSSSWHRNQRFFRFMTWSLCCTISIESRAWIEAKTRRARRFFRRPCDPSGNFWFLYNLLLLRVQASERRKNKNWNQKCISRHKCLGNQEKPAPGSVWKAIAEQSCTLMHHKTHHRDDFSSFLHAVDMSKERMTTRVVEAIKLEFEKVSFPFALKGLNILSHPFPFSFDYFSINFS